MNLFAPAPIAAAAAAAIAAIAAAIAATAAITVVAAVVATRFALRGLVHREHLVADLDDADPDDGIIVGRDDIVDAAVADARAARHQRDPRHVDLRRPPALVLRGDG